MEPIRYNHAGLIAAVVLGGMHLVWAILVATGWAQPVLDWILSLHFIRPVFVISEFHAATALALVAFTAAVGYTIGVVIAFLFNRGQAKRR